MTHVSARGVGLNAFNAASRNNVLLSGLVRPASFNSRPVCRPVLLAPGPRTPRRQRQRSWLVTTNFKQSDEHSEEAPVVRPKPVRHPLTEDAFSGAGPAETATSEVIFHAGSSAAAAAAPPQAQGFLRSTTQAARQMTQLLMRPRALLRALVRNAAAFGVPLLVAFFARPTLPAFWTSYCASLDSHPLLTKIATGIVGTIVGDYVAQKLSHQAEVQAARLRGEAAPAFVFDAARTSRLAIYGALVGTPIGHAWFQLLDTRIMPEAMTSSQAVITKMALDQLLMCPLATAIFFVAMRCWEGHPNDALTYMRGKMVPTLKANYVLWPLAHIINFAFVPPAQRILYCNAVGVIWTVILSTILNSQMPPAAGAPLSASGPSPVSGGGDGTLFTGASHNSVHAAGSAGVPAADMYGSSAGFVGGHLPVIKGRDGTVPPGAAATAFRHVAQEEAGSKDA